MKKFITAIILLSGLTANAGLKLSTTANLYDKGEHTRPAVGLVYYKQLMKKAGVQVYAGMGKEAFEDKADVTWATVKTQADFYIKDLTVSPGVMLKDVMGDGEMRDYMFVKLEYKLF